MTFGRASALSAHYISAPLDETMGRETEATWYTTKRRWVSSYKAWFLFRVGIAQRCKAR